MKDSPKHPIDELFSNKLNEDQPVSEDSLWNEVEGIMDNRKKKRRFLLFMLSMLLIASSVTGYFFLSNKTGKPVYTSANPQGNLPAQNSVAGEGAAANATGNSINNPQAKEDVSGANSTSASSVISNASKSQIKSNDNLTNTISSHSASGKTLSKNSGGVPATSGNHKALSSNGQASIVSKPKNEDLNNNVSSNQAMSEAGKAELANSNSGTTSDNNNTNKATPTISQALLSSSSVVENQIKDTSIDKPVAAADQPSKPKKRTHKPYMKWFVEADGSYMDNFHFISAPTNVTTNYDNIRGSDEKPLATFNYMLKVGAVRKNVMFNTGLGITNVGEKVKYTPHNNDSGAAIITNHTVFERNGSFVNEYLTVPLQVTYLIPIKAVRFQMGIGTAASIPLRWSSYYLNQQVDGLENPGSLKMVNSIVINLNLTLGLEVPFTRHWAGVVAFNYSRDVSNVFKGGYGVRQEYLSLGGDGGIRYTFGR